PDRGVIVKRHEKARAQRAGAGEVGDVAAVQQVENAVGEYQGAGKPAKPASDIAWRMNLLFEGQVRAQASVSPRQRLAWSAAGTRRPSACSTRKSSRPCARR